MQYGIRLHREYETISYQEFNQLLSGLGGETPLGYIVQIRAETDQKKIKEFNTYEKRLYNEWQEFRRNKNNKSERSGEDIQQWLKSIFGR
jgi:hypothetical protein